MGTTGTTHHPSIFLLGAQDAFYRIEDLLMHGFRRGHDALVIFQRPSSAEIERLPIRIRDLASSLPNDEIAGGMIPDLLLVVRSDQQPEIQIPGATGYGPVLGLGIHPHALFGDAELLRDRGLVAVRRVPRFYTLAESGLRDVRHILHPNRLTGPQRASPERPARRAGAKDGGEQDAPAFTVRAFLAHVCRQRRRVIDGEIRTGQHPDLDVAVFDQCEAYGVLAAAQKAFRAVDRIERPDAPSRAPSAAAGVDGLQHLLGALQRPAELLLCGAVVQRGGFDEVPDLGRESRVLAQGAGFFFADDLVVGEIVFDGADDQGLGTVVADGDG